jgi:Anti-sigma factor NepR
MKQGKPLRRNTPMDQYRSSSAPAKLGPEIRAKIGQQLHKIYDQVVNQGVPERFAEILRGLDDATDGGAQNERT